MTALEHDRPAPAVAGAQAGWYADPASCHQYRYWNGARWTPGVSDSGFVREDPLPDTPCSPSDARARPPLRAAGIGVGAVICGFGLAGLIELAFSAWAPGHGTIRFVATQSGLWACLLGACVLVSRRYGSGSVRRDFGLSVRLADIGWGLLLAIVARVLAAIVVVVLLLAASRLRHPGSAGPSIGTHLGTARLVVLCLALVVGAPLVEELFFRGLLLRSLQTRLPITLAVPAQAIMFSACHVFVAAGLGEIAELIATLLFGLLAGAVVHHFRRLGPTIVAHALFNGVAALVLILLHG